MNPKKPVIENASAEMKIKEAARKVFLEKGYAATRTRDIAEEAGINLALLNYYFRSKEKLFDLIMREKLQLFFGLLLPLLNNPETHIETKTKLIAENYIELLKQYPDLPIFILGELRSNHEKFVKEISIDKVRNSVFMAQIEKAAPGIDPNHYFINILAFCVFPFIMRPAFQVISKKSKNEFLRLMDERKQLIPIWTAQMLNAK